ncbi:MAG TPA: hypothetical protein VMN39_07810 [Longimicrobiaceae bacterium]|nr:hypothetical protein [Longimicrobiaceae bacterium]
MRPILVLALLLAATSCAGSGPESEPPTTEPPAAPPAASTPAAPVGAADPTPGSSTPAPPADAPIAARGASTPPAAAEAAGFAGTSPNGDPWTAGNTTVEKRVSGVATLAAARAASQPGFDRFVIEFRGTELPSYHIEYIDRPVRECGSGHVVEVAGDGWLLIRLEPARAHTDEGVATITERSTDPRLPIILQTRIVCDFEAQVEWVLGVASPNRYRVLELVDPTRLVVDIRRR